MRKFNTITASSAVLVLALSFGVSASALAHGTSSDDAAVRSSANTSSNTTTDYSSHTETEAHPSTQVDSFPATTFNEDHRADLQSRGNKIVKDLEKNHKTLKNEAQRKKICENRKTELNGKVKALLKNSNSIKSRIDTIYAKAQTYQQKNNLQPNGYADLIAAADTAKAQAASSGEALQAVSPTITCEGTNTVDDIATYKAAVQQTRDDLKTYRDAVKAVLKSLEITKKDSGSTN